MASRSWVRPKWRGLAVTVGWPRVHVPEPLQADKDVIAYCRIVERSSHTCFVLKYLLGYPDVRNYQGSWTEWGNLVRTPIENPYDRRAGLDHRTLRDRKVLPPLPH